MYYYPKTEMYVILETLHLTHNQLNIYIYIFMYGIILIAHPLWMHYISVGTVIVVPWAQVQNLCLFYLIYYLTLINYYDSY